MNIGIDIRPLSLFNDSAGLYQHTYNLVSNLLAIDSNNEYTLLSTLRGFKGDGRIAERHVKRLPGRILDLIMKRFSVSLERIVGDLDVFHGPCFQLPPCFRSKAVVTIHDLMPFRHPEFFRTGQEDCFVRWIHASLKQADVIITVSNFVKGELMELFHIPEYRVRVIYNGIADIFFHVRDKAIIEQVKGKYGIQGRYLLFVGNIEPKKNIETLIHAWANLRNSSAYRYPLVVAGKKSWYFETVWETVRQVRLEKNVIFTDIVSNEDLPCLYSGAELFVFPSLFEGFGIPVIEAMACGIPVVASNQTSIPEVAADAALLVNPMDAEGIAEAMYKILSDSSLKDHLIKRGLDRAKAFSWEGMARETLKLYEDVGRSG